jgi:hypothetical protein
VRQSVYSIDTPGYIKKNYFVGDTTSLEKKIKNKMFILSGNKMLSIEFLMLLILLLVIKTINASTLPSSTTVNEQVNVNNKCERISFTNCPELKYNQTMISNTALGHTMDVADANEMVSEIKY